MQVAADTSLLVALLNAQDVWNERALALQNALLLKQAQIVYFDCVVAEATSSVTRRLREKGRADEVADILRQIEVLAPRDQITWIFPDVPRLYTDVLGLLRSSSGELNFNDALIALACREYQIPLIASFDPDFDTISWLTRIASAQDIPAS